MTSTSQLQNLNMNRATRSQSSQTLRVPLCDISLLGSPELLSKGFAKKENHLHQENQLKMKRKHSFDDSPPKIKGLSEYERKALKNREEKMAFLQSLKINEIKEELYDSVEQLKKKPAAQPLKVRQYAKKKNVALPPSRKSLRIAKIKVDLSEEAILSRAEAQAMVEIEPIKHIKAEVNMNEILEGGSYQKFLENFSDLKHSEISDHKHSEYVTHPTTYGSMSTDDIQVCKLLEGRITALDFYPSPEELIVCGADKYGHVGLWNVKSGEDPFLLTPHQQGVTLLKFNPLLPNQLISSSYEGNLRCADLVTKSYDEVFSDYESGGCTYFDYLSATSLIASQEDGSVSIFDTRQRRSLVKKHHCHRYHIKTVNVHPQEKTYFITALRKGSINLWDLRKLQEEPIIELLHHKKSVNSAFFSTNTGKNILSTSLDDTLCIFDSSTLSGELPLKQSVRHNNCTGRWLSIFRAMWLPKSDDNFVVGNLSHPRRIEIYNDKMVNTFNFMDDNLTNITSVNLFHPHQPALAGGSSSGKVFLFTYQNS